MSLATAWSKRTALSLYTRQHINAGKTQVLDRAPPNKQRGVSMASLATDDHVTGRVLTALLGALGTDQIACVTWCTALTYEGSPLVVGAWMYIGPVEAPILCQLKAILNVDELATDSFLIAFYAYEGALQRTDGVYGATVAATSGQRDVQIAWLGDVPLTIVWPTPVHDNEGEPTRRFVVASGVKRRM